MKTRILTVALLATLLMAGASQAQQAAAPAPNPLDVVPDKMPFSEPYGAPITLEHAKHLIAAVQAEAKKRGWAMNISVVDSGGNLVAFERMDGAQLASISISEHKARAAVMYRRPTKVFEDAIQKGGFTYVMTLDGVIASRGGFPLIQGGKIIGALGCSGGTGSQDATACQVGADMVK
jgi:glc operon protein GlcG